MKLTVEPYPKRRAKASKPSKVKLKKERSISALIKDLDAVMSRFVRLSRADKEGMVQCFTCDKFFHYKKIQNGHYISRFYKAVRWDEDNCRPQCMWCNMYKNGDAANFRERLVIEIGLPKVLALEEARKDTQKLDRVILEMRILFFAEKLKPLTL